MQAGNFGFSTLLSFWLVGFCGFGCFVGLGFFPQTGKFKDSFFKMIKQMILC